MKLPNFDYREPTTLAEVLSMLDDLRGPRGCWPVEPTSCPS